MNGFIKRQFSKNDALLKHIFIFFIGSMLGNMLNYAYQLVVVRSLNPSDYGIFSSLFALLYIILMGASVMNIIVTKYTADFHSKEEYGKIKTLFISLSMKMLAFGMIAFAIFTISSRVVANFMKIESAMPVILVGIIGFLSLFSPIYDGILAGLQRFSIKSIAGLIGPLCKIGFIMLFSYMGYRVNGAFFALIIAQFIGILFYIIPNISLLKHKKEDVDKKEMIKLILPTFIGMVLPMILINIDIILVKHYLPSIQAGYYGAASMLAKVIFFLTGPLAVVMFPKISNLHSRGHDTGRILRMSILYTLLILAPAVLAYFMAPQFIINLLYGPEYKIGGIIGLFAIVAALFSLNHILINYNLAKNRFRFGYFIIIVGIIEVLAIALFHNSLEGVIKVMIACFMSLFLCLVAYTSKDLGIKSPLGITGLFAK